jgi:hypothetical protein
MSLSRTGTTPQTVASTQIEADGAERPVLTPVVVPADPTGEAIDLSNIPVLYEIRDLLMQISEQLDEALGSDLRQALGKKAGRFFRAVGRRE